MMVRIRWTLSRRLVDSSILLGAFPSEMDRVSLLNSSGIDDNHIVRRAGAFVIVFWQFINYN